VVDVTGESVAELKEDVREKQELADIFLRESGLDKTMGARDWMQYATEVFEPLPQPPNF